MLRDIDKYFLQNEEPVNSCLQFLRSYILKQDKDITEVWRYRMPFYYYKGKMCCYLWVHKKYRQPYLGIVEGKHINHPGLIFEKRSRMKIFLVDPYKNIPVKEINKILKMMLALYKE